eukprot:4626356-Amphidinium_carterae.4
MQVSRSSWPEWFIKRLDRVRTSPSLAHMPSPSSDSIDAWISQVVLMGASWRNTLRKVFLPFGKADVGKLKQPDGQLFQDSLASESSMCRSTA